MAAEINKPMANVDVESLIILVVSIIAPKFPSLISGNRKTRLIKISVDQHRPYGTAGNEKSSFRKRKEISCVI